MKALVALGFLFTIIAANYATSTLGLVPVGFGLEATAGTYFAGLAFVLRDSVQDLYGKTWTVGLIGGGIVISAVAAEPRIALESALAFGLSELVDLGIYSPLRARGYVRAALASNTAGTVVDTVLFLAVAGFPIWPSTPGQIFAKLTVTAVAVGLVVGSRAVSRQPRRA